MSGPEKHPDWDDGRTVADMSGVERPGSFRPQRQAVRQTAKDSDLTDRERLWAVLGALKATLLLAGAFLLGLALVIGVLLWMWR